MKIRNKFVFLFIVLLFTSFCSTSRLVRPLKKGQWSVGFDLGGPIITVSGITFPMPLSSVSAAYGFGEKLSGVAALHTTALSFGVFQLEAGIVYAVFTPKKWIPGLSVAPSLHFMTDIWQGNVKLYPSADINLYWNLANGDFIYAGISNWFEPAAKKAHGRSQNKHWLWSPLIGYTITPKNWRLSFELKFLTPDVPSYNVVTNFNGINGYGALGFYMSAARLF